MNKSEHLIVIKYLLDNPKSSLKNISLATGFRHLSLHRFLTDYELKKPRKIFSWINASLVKIDKNGKKIGGHKYLFSVRNDFNLENFLEVKPKIKVKKIRPIVKKTIQQDPITAAFFGGRFNEKNI
jgi:hypothetical protein